MSNSFDPDLERHSVVPDLGLNCLQRLSAKNLEYCGCSKISNTKVEANSADPDQTASKSLIRLFAVAILASILFKSQL